MAKKVDTAALKRLTQDEVAALPDGCRIAVKWSGGNGPWPYTFRDGCAWSDRGAASYFVGGLMEDVGDHPFTQVWLLEEPK